MRILLVEEDALLRTALTKMLAANRYSLDAANSGQIALELATTVEYDLVLLDLQSHLAGLDLCRQLRAQGYQTPILLLTADAADADLVAGFEAGADDYVQKAAAPDVLLARIKTLLRRSGASLTHAAPEGTILRWGLLSLDWSSGRVAVAERAIALTATEYHLLELFLRHPDRIFSRSAILDRLWSFDEAPTDRAVNTYMKDLRKKLKAGGLPEDCIETIYGMGYRLRPAPAAGSGASLGARPESRTASGVSAQSPDRQKTAVERVLAKYRDSFVAQVAVLERASQAGVHQAGVHQVGAHQVGAHRLEPELRQEAQQEAHKLAGSLASFGYPTGSKLARSIEHLLMQAGDGAAPDGLAELVLALQQELAKPAQIQAQTQSKASSAPAPGSAGAGWRVLVIDDDRALTAGLQAEAEAWGMQIQLAASLAEARSRLFGTVPEAAPEAAPEATPDVVLLDLGFPGSETAGLTLLQELTQQSPELPVIVFTGRDSLTDRLAVSRLGAKQFLHKPATPEQIFQAILRLAPRTAIAEAKVLIVDDDPAALALLTALLTPWGLAVVTLAEPQQFWQVLTASAPDLVLLDLEMPEVSGLDLCQVVRQDSQWGDLPILVVTAHTDAAALQQAFAAGVDDFITKPVLGPELVSRILSRIERNRTQPNRTQPNRTQPNSPSPTAPSRLREAQLQEGNQP